MVATAAAYDDGPIAFRYPRGEGEGMEMPERGEILEIGKGRIVQDGTDVALLSFGAHLGETRKAARLLEAQGLSVTIADARFAKPLDTEMVRELAQEHDVLITIEEGATGGFGGFVMQELANTGQFDHGLKFRTMVLPDIFIDQDSPANMYKQAGLDADSIVETVFKALGREMAAGASSA